MNRIDPHSWYHFPTMAEAEAFAVEHADAGNWRVFDQGYNVDGRERDDDWEAQRYVATLSKE